MNIAWFRCPNCSQPLEMLGDTILGCPAGHRFDRSKYGYVTLLPPRAPLIVGDSTEMVAARLAALRSGAFDALVAAVKTATTRACTVHPARLIDLGAGPGFYAAAAVAEREHVAVLLTDRSPVALRASRAVLPNVDRVVLDLWQPLPLRDATADVALNIFAPRNPAEYARILRPGGTLIVAVPRPEHLEELRAAHGILTVPNGKRDQVTAQLMTAGFGTPAVTAVHDRVTVSATTARHLVEMGPSAHHRDVSSPGHSAHQRITVAVDILEFVRPNA